MLQPFDPIATDTQKHKFMVQTMIAPPDFTMEHLDNVVRPSTPPSNQL